jgi:hypothetical protein
MLSDDEDLMNAHLGPEEAGNLAKICGRFVSAE